MKELLEYIKIISEVDTKDIEPLVHLKPSAELRDDEVTNTDMRKDLIAMAPASDGVSFITPRILK